LSKILHSKKRLSHALDLGVLKVDMHSHLIPGIDDGAKTMEDSIALIKAMKELGYQKLITTPHIMTDFYPNTSEIILKGLKNVKAALKKAEVDIEIEAAAEYLVDENFTKLVKKDDLLSFGDKYILIELSFFQAPLNLDEIIFELQIKGYKIILAHPERYTYWHNNWEEYKKLKNKEVFLQINMSSLSDYYGFPCRKIAERMLKENMVEFLGSDVHNFIYLQDIMDKVRFLRTMEKAIKSSKILNSTLLN